MGKKSTNSKLAKRLLESEKSILKTKYKFNIGDKVTYLGGMHKQYQNCVCIIISRSDKGNRIQYVVEFDDGVQKSYILERTLKLTIDDNINESEVNINENNQTII